MEANDNPSGEPGWQLPPVGAEVAHRLASAAVPPDELCAWLCAHDELHVRSYGAPLVQFVLEDATLLEDAARAMTLWERIVRARADGKLTGLRLALAGVRPHPVTLAWITLAAQAGVVELAFDLGALRVAEAFQLLADICVPAHNAGVMPRIPLPLVGPGIDLTESVTRAVIMLKGALPWQPAAAELTSEVRAGLSADLADAVEQGTHVPAVLAHLVLNPWFAYLTPADRRALFPVWLAVYQRRGEAEALAGVHPYLRPAMTDWVARQQAAWQAS